MFEPMEPEGAPEIIRIVLCKLAKGLYLYIGLSSQPGHQFVELCQAEPGVFSAGLMEIIVVHDGHDHRGKFFKAAGSLDLFFQICQLAGTGDAKQALLFPDGFQFR